MGEGSQEVEHAMSAAYQLASSLRRKRGTWPAPAPHLELDVLRARELVSQVEALYEDEAGSPLPEDDESADSASILEEQADAYQREADAYKELARQTRGAASRLSRESEDRGRLIEWADRLDDRAIQRQAGANVKRSEAKEERRFIAEAEREIEQVTNGQPSERGGH
jgi:hypothetical protein